MKGLRGGNETLNGMEERDAEMEELIARFEEIEVLDDEAF